MGTAQPYLKGKNAWWLRLFIGVNVAIFLSVVIGRQLTTSSVEHFWLWLSARDGMFALFIPLAAIVLNGVLVET